MHDNLAELDKLPHSQIGVSEAQPSESPGHTRAQRRAETPGVSRDPDTLQVQVAEFQPKKQIDRAILKDIARARTTDRRRFQIQSLHRVQQRPERRAQAFVGGEEKIP
jgi:hypothetical protein